MTILFSTAHNGRATYRTHDIIYSIIYVIQYYNIIALYSHSFPWIFFFQIIRFILFLFITIIYARECVNTFSVIYYFKHTSTGVRHPACDPVDRSSKIFLRQRSMSIKYRYKVYKSISRCYVIIWSQMKL